MTKRSRQSRACTLALLAVSGASLSFIVLVGSDATAGIQSAQRFQVEGSRPVAKASEVLSERFGWTITYEDPPYLYEQDLVDRTVVDLGDGHRALSPKPRRIELEEDLPAAGAAVPPVPLIRRILLAHARSVGGTAMFDVRQSGNVLHIVPIRVRDADGRWVRVDPVLDTPLTLAAEPRTLDALVRLVCESVSQATGVEVVFASGPVNLLRQHHTDIGAVKEPARDVLLRALARSSRPLTWQLLYRAGWNQYFFNIVPPGKLEP